ncbi:MAG: hypothetical protein AB8B57_10935 [Congregibacter sp.]
MNRRVLLLASPLLLSTLSLTACISTGDREVEITPATSLSTQVGKFLNLEFPSGDVTVVPSTDGQLHASARFFCNVDSKQCPKNADKASIVHEQNGERSVILFKPALSYSTRHANIVYRVEVPDVARLSIDVDAGDFSINSPTACLSVSAGAGDLQIDVPLSDVRGVTLDANLGDANLQTPEGYADDERTLLVGSEIVWDKGPGACDLDAKLQAGAINVRLNTPELPVR